MDVEARKDSSPIPTRGKLTRRLLLVALNCGMLALGTTAGPLLTRLYYDKGGDREWLSAWLKSGGWPLLLVPVAASYAARRARDRAAPLLLAPPRVLLAAAGLGAAMARHGCCNDHRRRLHGPCWRRHWGGGDDDGGRGRARDSSICAV